MATDDPSEVLLTVKETAGRFQVTIKTVYCWINDGKIAICRTPGGSIRICESVVRNYLTPKPSTH